MRRTLTPAKARAVRPVAQPGPTSPFKFWRSRTTGLSDHRPAVEFSLTGSQVHLRGRQVPRFGEHPLGAPADQTLISVFICVFRRNLRLNYVSVASAEPFHGQTLNIGMIGYGFMGRAHSNAYRKVNNFFDLELPARPQGRLRPRRRQGQGVRRQVGLRVRRDRLAEADRAQGHRRRSTSARRTTLHAEIALAAAAGRQDDPVREAAGDERPRRREDGRGRREGQGAEHGLVQLPPRAGRHAGQAAHRRGQARQDLPLPRQLPPGLDDQRRPAAGRHGPVAARRGRGRQRRHRRPARPLHRHRPLAQRRASTTSTP